MFFAILLTIVAVVLIGPCLVYWQRAHPWHWLFPRSIRLAFLGGVLALAGAVCFAIAAFLGG